MFVVRCEDKTGHQHVRLDNRERHLAYLDANKALIVMAGPLLDESRQTMIGSLLVIDTDDRAQLDAFLAGDPYAQAGLFASVTVSSFRRARP